MDDLDVIVTTVEMLFWFVALPIAFAVAPGIISYLTIRNRTIENLKRAKRVVSISVSCVFLSLCFLGYQLMFGPDQTSTRGGALILIGYLLILLPLALTIPMAIWAYRRGRNDLEQG